jgi:Tfp pilus assembly protein PilZ
MSDKRLVALLELFEGKGIKKEDKKLPPISPSISKNESLQKNRQLVTARLFVLINQIDEEELLNLLKEFFKGKKWVREYSRMPCYINVDFVVKDRVFNSYIRGISAGGVFIETSDSFSVGEEILLTFTLSSENVPFKVPSRIVRIAPTGIGVEFEEITQYQRECIESFTGSRMEIKKVEERTGEIDLKKVLDKLEMEI